MAGVERAVEDEPLDEVGRLEQGVLLAGRLGEVLVQVAQEPRVAIRVGEVRRSAPVAASMRWKKRSSSPAASPLSQLGSRMGLRAEQLPGGGQALQLTQRASR